MAVMWMDVFLHSISL